MYTANLVRHRQFWKVSVGTDNTVTISRGVLGGKGRAVSRPFSSLTDAETFARDAVADKEDEGFVALAPEDPTKRTTRAAAKKRAKEEAVAALSGTKKLRRSSRTSVAKGEPELTVKEEEALGEVDAHAKAQGEIVTLDGGVCDVMLASVDVEQQVDDFLVLQLIDAGSGKNPFVVFKRWGATGTVGQTWRATYKDLATAASVFTDMFQEAAGYAWGESGPDYNSDDEEWGDGSPRFNVMAQDYVVKRQWANGNGGAWEYWVDDGVDGKTPGWYPYTEDGAAMTENLWREKLLNPNYFQRVVRSGCWAYLVDLSNMTQMNVTHGGRKIRMIRRVAPGQHF